jgi:hypothetical protein
VQQQASGKVKSLPKMILPSLSSLQLGYKAGMTHIVHEWRGQENKKEVVKAIPIVVVCRHCRL